MDMQRIPRYVVGILDTLEASGFEAYLVGGCVRDMVMGKAPADWDIATSARTDEVISVFRHTVPTGIKHGTVTVLIGRRKAEVTTFRVEGEYLNGRSPDSVEFVRELSEDLSRRDFTINAMALRRDGTLVDLFEGMRDLGNRIIRCVGEPDKRFGEDALRMFRALRFAAKLGFELDIDTESAVIKNACLAEKLSAERIRDELEKILLSKRPELIKRVFKYGLMSRYSAELLGEPKKLAKLPVDKRLRWAGFCAMLETEPEEFLKSLRLDSDTVKACSVGAALAENAQPEQAAAWKRLIRDNGYEAASCAAAVWELGGGKGALKALNAVVKSGECFSVARLAVGGEDMKALGLSGQAVGRVLKKLLEYVIDNPSENIRERLLPLAREQAEMIDIN